MRYHNECACPDVLDIGPLAFGIRTSVLDNVTLKDIRNIACCCCMTLLGQWASQEKMQSARTESDILHFYKNTNCCKCKNNFKNTHCCKCKNILNFFIQYFQEHNQSVKQFASILGRMFCQP